MTLVMILLVRDEIDILRHNLSFHLASGVDHVVAIDNGSIDGTSDVLADFERQGVVTVIDEPEQDFSQSTWTTKAALIARDRFGADWILSNDADEFWVSREGNLKDQLRQTKADVLLCPRMNMVFPWDDNSDDNGDDNRDGAWATKCVYRVQKPVKIPRLTRHLTDKLPCPYFYLGLPDKALVRARHLTQITQGNHSAIFDHRAKIKRGEIDIFHFPFRSTSQFCLKVVNGGQAYARNKVLPSTTGWHWRRWYRMLQTQGIEAAMADALPNSEALERDLADGTVVEDHRMISLLDQMGL